MKIFRYIRSAGSFKRYYRLLNELYRSVYGREMMLHFPFYRRDTESFEQRQINLVDHCIAGLSGLTGKRLLEVGCGNGANCHYLSESHTRTELIGIDLNEENIAIANNNNSNGRTTFMQDDAQVLKEIPDRSVDVLICIESALHYPDKQAFFHQISRVLKPGGEFLIADILRRSDDRGRSLWWWKKHMMLHHDTKEKYHEFAGVSNLRYVKTEDITDRIVRGYEGYRNWIPRKNRSLGNFILLRLTLAILVRLYLRELKRHKKYVVFVGNHA